MIAKSNIKHNLYRFWGQLSPKTLAQHLYKKRLGKRIDWDNPKDLNEKIQWLKFYSDTSEWTRLADKYEVREYVKEKGFGENLVKLYGKWDKAENIDWVSLPDKFVMKVNNGSGDVVVCSDKKKLDINEVSKYFNKMLKRKYGFSTAEPHYLDIPPCIIAEEMLDVSKQPIVSSSLIDYKIWCFEGKPECVWACYNRKKGSVEVATYD